MKAAGTEHTARACARVPADIAEMLVDATRADRPLTPTERARYDEWAAVAGTGLFGKGETGLRHEVKERPGELR